MYIGTKVEKNLQNCCFFRLKWGNLREYYAQLMKIVFQTIFGAIISFIVFISCNEQHERTVEYFPKVYYDIHQLRINGKYDEALAATDSMRQLVTPDNNYGVITDALYAWTYCYTEDEDSAVYHAKRAIEGFKKITKKDDDEYAKSIAEMEMLVGYCSIATNTDTAIHYLTKCIERFKYYNDIRHMINANQYIAEIYKNRSEYTNSLHYLDNISDICDTIPVIDNDATWMLNTLTDNAVIATEIGDFRIVNNSLLSASVYYDQASTEAKIYYLYNRARAHFYQNEYALAAYTASRGEAMAEQANNYWKNLSSTYIIHGLSLSRDGYAEEAVMYRDKADSLAAIHDINLIKEKILLDGEIEANDKNFERARFLLFDSTETDHRPIYTPCLLESHEAYYIARNDYHSAYKIQTRQKQLADSLQIKIISPNNNRQLQSKISLSNRMRNEISAIRQKLADQKEKKSGERYIIAIIAIISIIAAGIFGWNNYKRFKQKLEKEKHKLQQDLADKITELKRQEDMVHVTTKHLSESIAYAEHIQRSILPQPEMLEMCDITGSFIFFSPLDIVSGDFYWFAQKGDHLIVCCADCTGHGIPGAFMSMIASTIISDICNRSPEDVKPSTILEELDSALIDVLGHNKSEEARAKDGCDISIISLNTKTKVLNVAAAKRPVIVIRDQEMIEVKGTKRSIGELEAIIHERKFEDTEIQLHTNDTIYMFSDGYSDQFGGQNNSRLNLKNIKRFLRATHNDDMDEQCLTMQDFFTQWKGDYPQTDDVIFIGIMV